MKQRKVFLVWATFAFLLPKLSLGFPEMVRHGYLSCTACHFNPNGGGLIRPFGRAIAQDVLSFRGKEGQGDFLWGAVKPPDWLNLGGDFRVVQTYANTPTYREARFILMQADVEAAAEVGSWTFVATIGEDQNFPSVPFSRRHYLLWRPGFEPRLHLMAGRYYQPFGINTPDHIIATKRGLGWDQGQETYNVTAAWLEQRYDVFVTANLGRPDDPSLNRERGISVRPRLYIGSRARLGVSYFYGGNTPNGDRHVLGPFTTFAFSEKLFFLFETYFQNRVVNNTWGVAEYFRLQYEAIQGLHFFVSEDYGKLDLANPASPTFRYGLGVQFFPHPHIEILASWNKQQILRLSDEFQDLAYLMLHIYL